MPQSPVFCALMLSFAVINAFAKDVHENVEASFVAHVETSTTFHVLDVVQSLETFDTIPVVLLRNQSNFHQTFLAIV